jgi:hypothetical protein
MTPKALQPPGRKRRVLAQAATVLVRTEGDPLLALRHGLHSLWFGRPV